MRLLKSEKCAIVICLVFLALAIGIGLGQRQKAPSFVVTESVYSGVSKAPEADAWNPGRETDEDFVININTAAASELEGLEGIGPVLAARIIAYRESEGGFKTIEDITKVQGIGAAIFENIRGHICVE